MAKKITYLILLGLFLFSCSKKQTVKAPVGDEILWASEKPRPRWAYEEPYNEGGMLYFVGMSYKYADEKSSREDAERDARLRAIRYLETAARETFERIIAELGLTGGVLNPSDAARNYVEMVAQGVVQKSKVVQWYSEQRKSAATGEIYYQTFAKLFVPEEQVMESFSDYVNRKREEWKMAQEQINRVNEVFRNYWESKKKEAELRQQEKEEEEK
ncbi:MAG: hypothetical protein ABIK77_05240 [candidate division WOR-3 bacterium]|uniref:Uncharacterized protein n=1 Tax=candidate division WOR-3 bacterium TaxID=2052148 RepID=A0A7V4FG90_UNCW3